MTIRKVLMLCKGNTCRSPLAEAILQDIVKKANLSDQWKIDSAGMLDLKGKKLDARTENIMKTHGLESSKKSRQIIKDDFYKFDYILGMDILNKKFLNKMQPEDSNAKCYLLGEFGLPEDTYIIRDPYYDNHDRNFETVYKQCLTACTAFFKAAQANKI